MNPIAERVWQPLPKTYYYVDYNREVGASIKQVEEVSDVCGAPIATTPLAAAKRTLEQLLVEAHLDAQEARGLNYTIDTWVEEAEGLLAQIAALELLIARLETQEPQSDEPVVG